MTTPPHSGSAMLLTHTQCHQASRVVQSTSLWHTLRSTVGSSAVGTIAGLSRYSTPADYYAHKLMDQEEQEEDEMELEDPDPATLAPIQLGYVFEPATARLYEHVTGTVAFPAGLHYDTQCYPWLSTSPDRHVTLLTRNSRSCWHPALADDSPDGLLEIKQHKHGNKRREGGCTVKSYTFELVQVSRRTSTSNTCCNVSYRRTFSTGTGSIS